MKSRIGGGMRILVVEDDRKVASFLERGLREEGYAVDVAHDGDDGSLKANVYDYDLAIDRLKHTGRRAGYDLDLTPKEFQLLEYFLVRPEQVVRRTELLEKVWDLSFDPMSNVVDVHVGNLRKKLRNHGDALIHTVRGVGYILEQGDEDSD